MRGRRGGNAIEFAMLLPFFVALLGATVEYGLVFHVRSVATTAVWEGCRAGAAVDAEADPSPEDVAQSTIAERMSANPWFGTDCSGEGGDCTITVTSTGSSPERTLSCTLLMAWPGLTGIVVAPDDLRVSALALYERQGA